MNLYKLNILSIAVFIYRVYTKTCPPVFTGHFQKIFDIYSTRSPTLTFSKPSKPKLKLAKFKHRISIGSPTIWNDFVED